MKRIRRRYSKNLHQRSNLKKVVGSGHARPILQKRGFHNLAAGDLPFRNRANIGQWSYTRQCRTLHRSFALIASPLFDRSANSNQQYPIDGTLLTVGMRSLRP